jgi:hypothetical protein
MMGRGRRLLIAGVLVMIVCSCGGGGGFAAGTAPASCTDAIPASEAWDHKVQEVTVRGVVISTLSYNDLYGGATLAVSVRASTCQSTYESCQSVTDLTVIIPSEDLGNFPNGADYYLGKTICAAGLIGGYQPTNMVVSSPGKIALAP